MLDHLRGLVVELADAAVHVRQIGFELILSVLELLDDRLGRGGDRRRQPDVGLVDDATDPGIDFVLATLGSHGVFCQAGVERPLDLVLVRRLRALDRRHQRHQLFLGVCSGGALGGEFGPQPLDLAGDHLVVAGQLLLHGRDDAGAECFELIGHTWSFGFGSPAAWRWVPGLYRQPLCGS